MVLGAGAQALQRPAGMNAALIVHKLLEVDAPRPPRRRKLFNGAVINHPYLGRLVIRVEDLDRVPPAAHWQAFKEDTGKPATPLYHSERSLHWGLKWFAHSYKPPYEIANAPGQEPLPPKPDVRDDPQLKAGQADWLRRHNITLK